MCKLCDEGIPQDHTVAAGRSRRDFLKVSAAGGAAGLGLFSDPTAVIASLPSGSLVRIRVNARNPSGESPPAEATIMVT